MQFALESDELTVNYDQTPVLWDICLKIPRGNMVGIIGPNGAGKSTLLKAALQLIQPLSGYIHVEGKVAYVPQRESVDWDFPITARDVVLMGLYGQRSWLKRLRKKEGLLVDEALQAVGMGSYADRQIGQLSGGQQQRLFLARALVQNADTLLLDEPFAGVDLTTEKTIVELLKEEKKKGKTVFVVHHDLPTVEQYFDWLILLNTRLIAAGPVAQVFSKENLANAFGKSQFLFDEAARLSAKSTTGLV
jgi:manganese/zinc/iron transport system ATP- binding protein